MMAMEGLGFLGEGEGGNGARWDGRGSRRRCREGGCLGLVGDGLYGFLFFASRGCEWKGWGFLRLGFRTYVLILISSCSGLFGLFLGLSLRSWQLWGRNGQRDMDVYVIGAY